MEVIAATEFLARSSTLTSVGWIGYIIIGAIAGWIAGKLVKGSGSGILMNIVIGVIGALAQARRGLQLSLGYAAVTGWESRFPYGFRVQIRCSPLQSGA